MSAVNILVEKELTGFSTPEEVVEFFILNFNLKKNDLIEFIKEDISGDVLPLLNKQDLKELGLKLGHWKKIDKFINDNKGNLLKNQNEIKINEIEINSDSDINNIKTFFEKYLNFKINKDNFDIDGKKLFSMNEQDMKNLGLTLGKRKKLNKYIEYILKKIKDNYNPVITEKSTSNEIATFLKHKFNMPEKIIEEMALDGESLTLLKEEDIDEIEEMPEEIKNEFKNYIKEINNDKSIKEKEIETQKENFGKNIENNGENNNCMQEKEIEELTVINKMKTKNNNTINFYEKGKSQKKEEIQTTNNNNITRKNIDNNGEDSIEELPLFDIEITPKDKNNNKKNNLIDDDEIIKDTNENNNLSGKDNEEKKEEDKYQNILIDDIEINQIEKKDEIIEKNLIKKSILKEYEGEDLTNIKTIPLKNYQIVQ